MARGLLIFLNLVVLLIYMALFILLEPLLHMVAAHIELTPQMQTVLRYFLLIVIGFCMGNLTQIFTRTQYSKTYWDIKSFILLSLAPILFLLAISIQPVVDIIIQLPFAKDRPSEFLYYLISSRNIWILWIGINLGASIKFPQFYVPKRARKPRKQRK